MLENSKADYLKVFLNFQDCGVLIKGIKAD